MTAPPSLVLLRNMRRLVAASLILFALYLVLEPPYSVLGTAAGILILVLQAGVLALIHRAVVSLRSSDNDHDPPTQR